MSIQIQLNPLPVQKAASVHVLPCHIAYDGSAKVSQHFRPRTDPIDESFSTSSFRGRKLCGKTICLPKNYSGSTFVLLDLYRSRFPSDRFSRAIRPNKLWRRWIWWSNRENNLAEWREVWFFDDMGTSCITWWETRSVDKGDRGMGCNGWRGSAIFKHRANYRWTLQDTIPRMGTIGRIKTFRLGQ